jgi:hypothetical protein
VTIHPLTCDWHHITLPYAYLRARTVSQSQPYPA